MESLDAFFTNGANLDIDSEQIKGRWKLFENRSVGGNWVAVDIRSEDWNPLGYGARIRVDTAHGAYRRELNDGSGGACAIRGRTPGAGYRPHNLRVDKDHLAGWADRLRMGRCEYIHRHNARLGLLTGSTSPHRLGCSTRLGDNEPSSNRRPYS